MEGSSESGGIPSTVSTIDDLLSSKKIFRFIIDFQWPKKRNNVTEACDDYDNESIVDAVESEVNQ